MEAVLENTSLTKRAYWLVKLRWIAVLLLAAGTFLAENVLNIRLHKYALYSIAIFLFLYNITLFLLLNHVINRSKEDIFRAVNRIIILQVSADLFCLAGVIYFTGSVENPFSFFFVFHIIIASMLLSRRLSYFQASLAVVLFGLLVWLEYFEIIHHYTLGDLLPRDLYQNGKFVFIVFIVFSATMYLVVYMTSSIVSQLRIQQERYRQANLMLEDKDQVKNRYIMRVTHDIKSHLAAIKSCLDIVNERMVGELNEKQSDLVGRADHRADKCIAFITSLLKITKVRLSGNIDQNNFSLKYSIYNAFALVESKAVSKRIDLSYEIEPSIAEVYGNSVLIEDTITNLLLNAIKYTPEGGTVRLNAKDQGSTVLLQIIDTGIGIPSGELDKVFNEFFRASNAKKIERDGSGLGLALAKEVIERHGGDIRVESNPNGSTFSITLPKTSNQQ